MRIYEIAPGEKQEIDDNIERYLQLVSSECTQALSAMKQAQKFLYRGYANQQALAFKGQSRNDRRPLSSEPSVAEKFDEMFDYAGIAAKRSNSIFCTSKFDDAGFYTNYKPGTLGGPRKANNIYMIFPIDGFQFSWASKTPDLFGDWSPYSDTPELMAYNFDKIIDKFGISDQMFPAAIKSGNEVLISGQYYAFNDTRFRTSFLNLLTPQFTAADQELHNQLFTPDYKRRQATLVKQRTRNTNPTRPNRSST